LTIPDNGIQATPVSQTDLNSRSSIWGLTGIDGAPPHDAARQVQTPQATCGCKLRKVDLVRDNSDNTAVAR
jgi:hypothetical protein